LRGLAGIPEQRDNIVRPLIPFSRGETTSYCQENRLWTHDDPANEDLAFSRARFRSRIIPELKLVNTNLDSALLRLAAIADEEDRFLNGMAAAALEQAERPLNGELRFLSDDVEMRFDRSQMEHLPIVLRKRAVRLACEVLGAGLSFEQTQIASMGIESETVGSITAEGGDVVVEWSKEFVNVRRIEVSSPFRCPLTVPGETLSDDFGWQFTAFEAPSGGGQPSRASLETKLDAAMIKEPLHFRSVKPGDTMQPLGFTGRRKLSDLLSEARLSQAARARFPVVCDMIGPLWAPGVCMDERARPNALTTQVIVLRFSTLKA
jgi:tRNA(Ile)-lysidine synthase